MDINAPVVLDFYRTLLNIASMLCALIGIFTIAQAALSLRDGRGGNKYGSTTSLFLYGVLSFFSLNLLLTMHSDFGAIEDPLLRIFYYEAIDGIAEYKEFLWFICATASLLILFFGLAKLLKIDQEVTLTGKVFTLLFMVYSLEGIQYLYFDYIY